MKQDRLHNKPSIIFLAATHMNRIVILLLFLTGSLLGCATHGDFDHRALDAEFFWRSKSTFAVDVPAAVLCQNANNQALDRRTRCEAVARLFANFVKPGSTSEQMLRAIPDKRWLSVCSVYPYGASGGGSLPVYNGFDYAPFILRLFPDSTGWSDWVIVFNLPEPVAPLHGSLSSEEALAFLSGTHPDKRLKLVDFVIQYPICGNSNSPTTEAMVAERFTEKGVGLRLH